MRCLSGSWRRRRGTERRSDDVANQLLDAGNIPAQTGAAVVRYLRNCLIAKLPVWAPGWAEVLRRSCCRFRPMSTGAGLRRRRCSAKKISRAFCR